MKPICVPCQRFYRPKINGIHFVEGCPTKTESDHAARPGKIDAGLWKPYKLWQGDLWQCPGCQSEIVVGTGRAPIAEHFQPDFKDAVADTDATLQINDC